MAGRMSKWWVVVLVSGAYFFATLRLMNENQGCPQVQRESSKGAKPESELEHVRNRNTGVRPFANAVEVGGMGDDGLIRGPKGNDRAQIAAGPDVRPIVGPVVAKTPNPKPPRHFDIEDRHFSEILDPKLAPNNVVYVWCGKRWFEFHNYLSVMSVIRELHPDNIIFYYDIYPVLDYWLYNTWFDEIRREFPFFRIRQLGKNDHGCIDYAKPNMTFIYDRISFRGGMYINEHTILTRFTLKLRSYSLVYGLDQGSERGFMLTKPGFLDGMKPDTAIQDNVNTVTVKCASVSQYSKMPKKPLCINTQGVFYPKDIWELNNDFGRVARKIFYNNPEINLPKRNYDELIPNIAHVVWIGGGEMDYLFYLCILSLLHVAHVERVYIHGDGPPSGPLWAKLKDNYRIILIYRELPQTIFGTEVKVLSHVTDIWRVDFMVKYGGIYVDTDTLFVKRLDRDIRAYDAVGSVDWTYWNPPFPDTINYGVAIGKRNATYWRLFQKSMDWFIDRDWSWNGLRQPYRIKERHPELALIDPHLQVICFQYRCHPTWWPNYHNESIHHLNSDSIKNWREDAYAFHFTLPTPPELLSEQAMLQSKSIIGEMGRNVLEMAGLLKT